MIQALHAILGDGPDDQKSVTEEVTLLYGSRNKRDILGGDMLQTWAGTHTEKFKHIDVLSHEPEDSDYKGERGFIDRLRSTCLQLALAGHGFRTATAACHFYTYRGLLRKLLATTITASVRPADEGGRTTGRRQLLSTDRRGAGAYVCGKTADP
jgi:hypothetical protein